MDGHKLKHITQTCYDIMSVYLVSVTVSKSCLCSFLFIPYPIYLSLNNCNSHFITFICSGRCRNCNGGVQTARALPVT